MPEKTKKCEETGASFKEQQQRKYIGQ